MSKTESVHASRYRCEAVQSMNIKIAFHSHCIFFCEENQTDRKKEEQRRKSSRKRLETSSDSNKRNFNCGKYRNTQVTYVYFQEARNFVYAFHRETDLANSEISKSVSTLVLIYPQ